MVAVLAFAVVLLLAVLVSGLAHRSVLSTAVLFLLAGFVLGEGVLGLVVVQPRDPVVETFAELALFSVLFTDGMRVGLGDLRSAWVLPGRALALGLPLTLLAIAVLANLVADLRWPQAFLIGAALSPTDPVFAAAIVGRQEISSRLRHLLNVESGVNDGLALPVVVIMLAVVSAGDVHLSRVLGEVALGVALGVTVPLVAVRLERTRLLSATTKYEPLNAFAVGLLVFALTSLTHANEFLAAFAAGITIATVGPELREAFERFGELVAEILKLAALLVFGALISPSFLGEISPGGYLFAFLALLAARPAAIGLALLGSRLPSRERVAAAWFGPKGFASVVYGLLILKTPFDGNEHVFHLIAVVVAASIVAHSSTDVVVARWLGGSTGARDDVGEGDGDT